MRASRIIALALVAVLMLGSLVSCKPAQEITVTLKVYKHDGESILELDNNCVVQGAEPTVLEALQAACLFTNVGLEMSPDGGTIERIDGYGVPVNAPAEEEETPTERPTDENGDLVPATTQAPDPLANYYWSYTLNGKEPEDFKGGIKVQKVANGDVIEFRFVEFVIQETTTKKK